MSSELIREEEGMRLEGRETIETRSDANATTRLHLHHWDTKKKENKVTYVELVSNENRGDIVCKSWCLSVFGSSMI